MSRLRGMPLRGRGFLNVFRSYYLRLHFNENNQLKRGHVQRGFSKVIPSSIGQAPSRLSSRFPYGNLSTLN